jgi:hypothetical protein
MRLNDLLLVNGGVGRLTWENTAAGPKERRVWTAIAYSEHLFHFPPQPLISDSFFLFSQLTTLNMAGGRAVASLLPKRLLLALHFMNCGL